MRSVHEALVELMAAFEPVGVERAGLLDAHGRFAAEEVVARSDLPPFDNSAMDGYALRAGDVAGASEASPVVLPVRGESRAGGALPAPLAVGSAMRIFTGAPVPEGADAVVVQEDTERDGAQVRIRFASRRGAHVRARASDVAAGSVVLRPGDPIGPGEIALLASQRIAAVAVHRRPVVALLSTGDELRAVDAPEEPGTIVDSNGYALAAQVRDAGAIPRVLPIAPDDPEIIRGRLEDALGSDVVLLTGGASVGAYDFVHEALERAGVERQFWKVRIKPGKPVVFGRRGRVPVVGLPGNPVSAMVTFEVLVRPALRKMLGDPAPHPEPVAVRLAHDHSRSPGRLELARATLARDGEGWTARLHALQGSGSLRSMAGVDALVIFPSDRDRFVAGELLVAIRLRRRGSTRSPFEDLA